MTHHNSAPNLLVTPMRDEDPFSQRSSTCTELFRVETKGANLMHIFILADRSPKKEHALYLRPNPSQVVNNDKLIPWAMKEIDKEKHIYYVAWPIDGKINPNICIENIDFELFFGKHSDYFHHKKRFYLPGQSSIIAKKDIFIIDFKSRSTLSHYKEIVESIMIYIFNQCNNGNNGICGYDIINIVLTLHQLICKNEKNNGNENKIYMAITKQIGSKCLGIANNCAIADCKNWHEMVKLLTAMFLLLAMRWKQLKHNDFIDNRLPDNRIMKIIYEKLTNSNIFGKKDIIFEKVENLLGTYYLEYFEKTVLLQSIIETQNSNDCNKLKQDILKIVNRLVGMEGRGSALAKLNSKATILTRLNPTSKIDELSNLFKLDIALGIEDRCVPIEYGFWECRLYQIAKIREPMNGLKKILIIFLHFYQKWALLNN